MSLDYEIYPLKKLNEGASVFSGFAFKSNDFSDEGIPIVKIKNIQNKSVDLKEVQYFPLDKVNNKHKKFFLKNNDVLIAMTGQGSLGRVGRINLESNEYVLLNQRVGKFVVDEKNLHLNYLYHVISSDMYEKILFDRGTGSGQPNLSPEIILGTEIPMPNLTIQKKISSILDNINSKITLNKKINKNLDELCHSLFKYYFIDFIPFCDDDFIDSDIGEIPKEWSITTVGNILDCKLGGTPSRSNESYWGGSIAWINSGKVNDFRIIEPSEYITEKGLKKSATKLLPAKTTVIAITGATLGQISLLEIDSCANQSVIGIIPNINYPYEFVYPLISSILIDLLKHQTGGAQQHINKNNVESFKIICPPAEIISEYKTIVSPIYSKISDNCFEIEKLQKLRDTLLPKLMSGEIDVSKINCDLELKYNYMKYLFNQIHKQLSKSVV